MAQMQPNVFIINTSPSKPSTIFVEFMRETPPNEPKSATCAVIARWG